MEKKKPESSPAIRRLRDRIDVIDDRITALLEERAQRVLSIGRLKRESDLPVYCPAREREILERLARKHSGPLSDAAIRRLFERIIDESRSLERTHRGDPTSDGNEETGG